jgi:hypothetical protein
MLSMGEKNRKVIAKVPQLCYIGVQFLPIAAKLIPYLIRLIKYHTQQE